jgi:hypothetical protein
MLKDSGGVFESERRKKGRKEGRAAGFTAWLKTYKGHYVSSFCFIIIIIIII